jgi:beta-glucosidase
LWRVQHGELDGIAPRAVVLSIGTNDLGSNLGVDATVKGITACVHAIRRKLPKTTIVVLGILPRGDGGPASPMRRDVASVNARLAPLGRAPATRYLDIGSAFTKGGQVRRELFRPDLLHLSTEGYRVWAATLRPEITALVSSSS